MDTDPYQNRPNLGGTIKYGNGMTRTIPPSQGLNSNPNRPGSGGTIIGRGQVREVAPGYAPMQMNSLYDETADRQAATAARAIRPPQAVRPASIVARSAPGLNSLDGYDPGSFGAQNAAANAGVYAPGSFGDQNAQANGTGYRPSPGTSVTGIKAPPQTERANPLSGDNNIPSESSTTSLPPPFVQRGSGVPRGQDSMAPVKMTQTMDADIGTSMQGTQDRLRGTTPLYRPQFQQQQQPQRQKSYEDYRRSIFG